MMTPPPVSGVPYSDLSSSEARTNYLSAGVTFNPSYINNVLPNATTKPVGDVILSVLPNVSLSRTTPRQKEIFSYSPNFSFNESTGSESTSGLDSFDQSATGTFQYRVTPRVSVILSDTFLRTSDVFNESYPFSNPVSGSTLTSTANVIAPYAEQLVNSTSGNVSYQFGRNAMVGGGASYSKFDLLNPQQAMGLYNSNNTGAIAYYSRRLSSNQYFGVDYQYARDLTYPLNETSEVQIHQISPFYTFFFNRVFSLSLTAGIEYVGISGTASPASSSWSPSGTASLGWQGKRGYLAASFTRNVSSGNGLVGAYSTNVLSGSGGWDLSRRWRVSSSLSYSNMNEVANSTSTTITGGNSVAAQIGASHSLSERCNISFVSSGRLLRVCSFDRRS
jgi:hypothetical protein